MVETTEGSAEEQFSSVAEGGFWSFFGVRRRCDLESDASLNPLHLIAAEVIGAELFIVVLLVVRAVVR